MVGVCLDLTTGLLVFFESLDATDDDFDSLPCSNSGVRGDFSIGRYEPIGSVNPNLEQSCRYYSLQNRSYAMKFLLLPELSLRSNVFLLSREEMLRTGLEGLDGASSK